MDSRKQIDEFRCTLTVEECVKANVPQIFGLHGASSGGKSVTALILAQGLVGADKTVGVIDGENRRSGWAADVMLDLAAKHYGKRPPNPVRIHIEDCHPLAVVAGIEELLSRGCSALVLDCLTQAWETYLDLKEQALDRMSGDDWKKRERNAMAAAARTKPWTHGVLVRTIRGCKAHTVLCFRAKRRVNIVEDKTGKTKIVQDDFSTPIQESGLIFDCLVAGEVVARDGIGGYCLWSGPGRKTTHPDVLKLLPGEHEQFHFRHAEALSKWAAGGVAPQQAPQTKPTTTPANSLRKLKSELWAMAQQIHLCQAGDTKDMLALGKQKLEQHLIDEGYLADTETLDGLTGDRLTQVIEKLKVKHQ